MKTISAAVVAGQPTNSIGACSGASSVGLEARQQDRSDDWVYSFGSVEV